MRDSRTKRWLTAITVLCMIMLLSGCKTTRYVPVERMRTEYKDRVVAVHDTVRDSVLVLNHVYRHDSVSVLSRGDTVYVERWHTLLQSIQLRNRAERSKAAHDTLYVTRTDSVRVPVPVERKLTKWEKAFRVAKNVFAVAGVVVTLAVMAFVVLWLIERRQKR
ncbi:MAG: hypothetical protein MSS51_08585 [Bacteroidales bacterium]|nr:hypothetical protein [Bacteroidales bacterium]